MPQTGPLSRVSDALEGRRDRARRRPVDGTSVRLGALVVFLALVALMVLTASPSSAATSEPGQVAWSGAVNLAPILFWAAVAIGLVVRVVLGRRPVRDESVPQRAASPGEHRGAPGN